jgi:hypothetical protein
MNWIFLIRGPKGHYAYDFYAAFYCSIISRTALVPGKNEGRNGLDFFRKSGGVRAPT